MSQVELTTLGRSCEFFNGKAHEKSIDENGKYIVVNSKFISSEGKSFKRTNEQMFPLYKGDIVMVMSDVPNGKALAKCFIIDKDDTYSLNQRICCIRSKEFDTKYLYYQLNRHEHFLAFNNGENQTNLRKDDILACHLIKPSIEEQKRLVNQIDHAFNVLKRAGSNVNINILNSLELYDGVISKYLKETTENFGVKQLGEIAEIVNGGTPDTKVKEFWDGEILWITPKDMGKLESIYVGDTERKITDKGLKNSSAKLLPINSVILSSRAPIGHLAINIKPISTNQGCKGIVPNKNLDSLFLYYFLKHSVELLNELGTGTTFKELSGSKLATVSVPFPPLEEQQRLVTIFSNLENFTKSLTVKYNQKIEIIEQLKSGILKGTFENELIEAE
ncbi:MAG: restriction endonuclease subunit S [Chitinophagaceae bacterium]